MTSNIQRCNVMNIESLGSPDAQTPGKPLPPLWVKLAPRCGERSYQAPSRVLSQCPSEYDKPRAFFQLWISSWILNQLFSYSLRFIFFYFFLREIYLYFLSVLSWSWFINTVCFCIRSIHFVRQFSTCLASLSVASILLSRLYSRRRPRVHTHFSLSNDKTWNWREVREDVFRAVSLFFHKRNFFKDRWVRYVQSWREKRNNVYIC